MERYRRIDVNNQEVTESADPRRNRSKYVNSAAQNHQNYYSNEGGVGGSMPPDVTANRRQQ